VDVPVTSSPVPGNQVIPRPPGAHPGEPAPWAVLPAEARRGITLERVRRGLARPRLGDDPAWRVAVDELPGTGVPAAVLAALFEEDGEARVLLTRRAAHLRDHRGEVSFPGGRLDDGESPEDGARREAAEEVGLDPAAVDVVGRLSPLSTLSSQARITPVVGVLAARPAVRPNPHEVEHVFDVSLAELAADGVFREERWLRPGRPPAHVRHHLGADGSFPVWFFELPHDTVWGATARVLVELLRLTLGV